MLRRLILGLSVTGLLAMALVAQGSAALAGSGNGGSGGGNGDKNFTCSNASGTQVQVVCVGQVSIFPINVTVSNTRVLSNDELNVLSGDLDNVAVKDVNVLDANQVLNDVDVVVLNDFLNKFKINISNNDVNVCTNVAGIQVCKS